MSIKYNLPTATPESQGLSSGAILNFIEEIEREHIELQSLILLRHNRIIADGYWSPFAMDKTHRMFSAAKAVVGVATLFAIQEGLLKLNDKVMDLFLDKISANPSENLKALTFYHLLSMTSGHARDPFAEMLSEGADRAAIFFEQEFVYEPGTHFLYDNGVPDILGMTIYRLTGKTVLDYLQPRLFEPLGMHSFHARTENSLNELFTLCCSTADLFRLTRFYYQGGRWEGKQLLKEKLARMACSYLVASLQYPEPPAVAYDTKFGYGFQIWRNSVGGFRIDGGRGQFGIGIPEMDLIACMNANEGDQNIIPVMFWKHITNRLYARPLKENSTLYHRLQVKLESLSWAPAKSDHPRVQAGGDYLFDDVILGVDRMEIRYRDGQMTLTTHRGAQTFELSAGKPGEWRKGRSPFLFPEMQENSKLSILTVPSFDTEEIYTSGHWISTSTYELIFRSDAWMGANVLTFDFNSSGIRLTSEDGISYCLSHRSPSIRPDILGTRIQKYKQSVLATKT
jgi:CubicO group peptidase (beta-lactamase class C family)